MGKRILLVDDEPLILKGLKYTLEQEGYETDSAMDGEEALAKRIAQAHADAVMREILALSCPTEQKLALLDAVMDDAKKQGLS